VFGCTCGGVQNRPQHGKGKGFLGEWKGEPRDTSLTAFGGNNVQLIAERSALEKRKLIQIGGRRIQGGADSKNRYVGGLLTPQGGGETDLKGQVSIREIGRVVSTRGAYGHGWPVMCKQLLENFVLSFRLPEGVSSEEGPKCGGFQSKRSRRGKLGLS